MTTPRFFLTDVFAAQRYGGNQLATFVDSPDLGDDEMARIARELGFPQTTFVAASDDHGAYRVRIFSPNGEVDFAGHPIVGSAHVIATRLHATPPGELTLTLNNGPVLVEVGIDPSGLPVYWMQQKDPEFGREVPLPGLSDVFGVDRDAFAAGLPALEVSTGVGFVVVPMASLAALRSVTVDQAKADALTADGSAKAFAAFTCEGYVAEEGIAVRVFAGAFGTPEDVATGSANACLAGYLLRHKVLGTGPVDVMVGQGYEVGRPSRLGLRAAFDGDQIQLAVGGTVVEVAEGTWS